MGGEKSAWTRLVRSASEFRQASMFWMSFHTRLTLRASWYAPPDTGVPNLQLVAVEQLLSIEGALEIQMDVTFLRGKAPLAGELSAKLTERLPQILIRPLRLGFAEPPPLGGEALGNALQWLPL